jgi:hypothetical protein
MRCAVVFLPFLTLVGCSGMMADRDGRALGEDLGAFDVSADLEESSCGPGALGSQEKWNFDIRLSREAAEIFWNSGGGDAVVGTLAADGVTFSFASEKRVEVIPQGRGAAGCAVLRRDQASGVLDETDAEVRGFSGRLTYEFESDAEADCAALVGVEAGFEELPCSMSYDLSAVRVSE